MNTTFSWPNPNHGRCPSCGACQHCGHGGYVQPYPFWYGNWPMATGGTWGSSGGSITFSTNNSGGAGGMNLTSE